MNRLVWFGRNAPAVAQREAVEDLAEGVVGAFGVGELAEHVCGDGEVAFFVQADGFLDVDVAFLVGDAAAAVAVWGGEAGGFAGAAVAFFVAVGGAVVVVFIMSKTKRKKKICKI